MVISITIWAIVTTGIWIGIGFISSSIVSMLLSQMAARLPARWSSQFVVRASCRRRRAIPLGGVHSRVIPGSVHTWHVASCLRLGLHGIRCSTKLPLEEWLSIRFLWGDVFCYVTFGISTNIQFEALSNLFVSALVRCVPSGIKYPSFISRQPDMHRSGVALPVTAGEERSDEDLTEVWFVELVSLLCEPALRGSTCDGDDVDRSSAGPVILVGAGVNELTR